jgi:hypothetical protein
MFCVDEKTAIQALDRLDPVLPLSASRAQRHAFEYDRLGTLSHYAALNTATGEFLGKTAARHINEEFVEFLAGIIARPLHTTYSSLLNEVEIWFSAIELDVSARGIRTSVKERHKKLMALHPAL